MGEAWKEPPPALWQWEHRTGFKDYDEDLVQRIEEAYLRGDPYVRLKTGKTRSTPMELFFVDMIQHDPITGNQRNIRRSRPDRCHELLKRKFGELSNALETGRVYRMRFDQYMEKRREALKDLDRKEYQESHFYKSSGCCATIARHPAFGFITITAVVLNSLWLGVDANFNKAATIWQADAGFQVAEHTFSVIFLVELAIRFGALRLKRYIFQDGWLLFDTVLVAIMVGENLVMFPMFVANGDNTDQAALGDVSIFRLAKLLKLTRLTRVARILRATPEVLTMLKALTYGLRSVAVTIMLLIVLVYLFGIIFKIQSKSYPELTEFPTVGESMWVLILNGTFLDAVADLVVKMKDISWLLTFMFMVFIFLSNMTILNMLVGIFCEVATQVDKREKEQGAVSYLKHHLLEILEVHDKNDDRHINKDDFELLMRNPEMHMILKTFGVDTEDLLSLQDMLFESKRVVDDDEASGKKLVKRKSAESAGTSVTGDLDETLNESGPPDLQYSKSSVYLAEPKRLRFAEFLEVVLRLRGGNGASVRDVVEFRDYLRMRLDHLSMHLPKLPSPSASGDEALSPLRAAGAGFDSPPSGFDECSFPCEEAKPGVVGAILAHIEEVREDLRVMRGQISRLECAQGAPPKVEETEVTVVTPRAKSAEPPGEQ